MNRPADQRKALVRNLITSLFLNGKLKTTDAKAKVLSSEIEKLIGKVKKQETDFNGIRELNRVLFGKVASKKAFEYIKASKKTSGFTRMIKVGHRDGDNALVTYIELITE